MAGFENLLAASRPSRGIVFFEVRGIVFFRFMSNPFESMIFHTLSLMPDVGDPLKIDIFIDVCTTPEAEQTGNPLKIDILLMFM